MGWLKVDTETLGWLKVDTETMGWLKVGTDSWGGGEGGGAESRHGLRVWLKVDTKTFGWLKADTDTLCGRKQTQTPWMEESRHRDRRVAEGRQRDLGVAISGYRHIGGG